MPFNLSLLNVFQLPINDVNEENLSSENIDSVHLIENNQAGNHIENNQAGNHIENNQAGNHIENIQAGNHIENDETEYHIENDETEYHIENNQAGNHIENNETEYHIENNQTEYHIENNQTENHNNLIAETQEPNETSQKLDDKTNKKPKGGRNENLTRMAVKISFFSLLDMINEIVNYKLNKVTTYYDISGNSAEKYKEFFKKEIGKIIGRTNGKLVESILNSNDTTKEIQFLKDLFKTEYLKIIEIFMNDLHFSFTKSNGGKVEYKTIQYVTDAKIQEKIFDIRAKIKKIIQSKGRLRARSKKNK